MRSSRANFEVRCPRCDVSFAAGNKRCIHCGGPTTKPARSLIPPTDFVRTPGSGESSTGDQVMSARPIEPESGGLPPFAGPFEVEEEEAPSGGGLGRSVIGSIASLVWIAIVIAFSIFGRACGE